MTNTKNLLIISTLFNFGFRMFDNTHLFANPPPSPTLSGVTTER
jgi:hypothetical protein